MRSQHTVHVAIVAAVVILLTGALPLAADDNNAAKTVHNNVDVHLEQAATRADIIDGVRSAILRYPRYNVFDYVEFEVDGGEIRLQGSVLHPWKKTAIESRVARVPGVLAIENDITVQSAPRKAH